MPVLWFQRPLCLVCVHHNVGSDLMKSRVIFLVDGTLDACATGRSSRYKKYHSMSSLVEKATEVRKKKVKLYYMCQNIL